jgi:hypothetical protein
MGLLGQCVVVAKPSPGIAMGAKENLVGLKLAVDRISRIWLHSRFVGQCLANTHVDVQGSSFSQCQNDIREAGSGFAAGVMRV